MNPPLLLVDDDDTFRDVLARAFSRRGYVVRTAANTEEAVALASEQSFGLAVVDLRMPGDSGLTLIERLIRIAPAIRIVVLTGYASIATAVEAIKLGAIHYLTKPTHVDDIIAAFSRQDGDAGTPVASAPPSVDRLEWEHIQKILRECNGNISEAARRLGMHRRTLQRKLQKRPVRR